ncbi:MAG: NADP-dependent oxidoreductase [Waterburya sp.]
MSQSPTAIATMKAIRIHDYGGLENIVYEDVSRPIPQAGQVLVKVAAAGVNPIDWKIRMGLLKDFFPYGMPLILGTDLAGVVADVGEDVTGLTVGQPVYGVADMTLSGSYAEYALGRAEAIAPKPQTLSDVEAAGVAIVALTAWQALFEMGELQSGQSVLIHGAAGGVGSYAVQFAKLRGIKVFATASANNLDYVRDLGADEVIDYKTTPFEQVVNGVDMVLDTVGGETQTRSLDVLKPGGILVTTATPPDPDTVKAKGVRAVMMMVQPKAEQLTEIAALFDNGKIQPPEQQVIPLAEARRAHELSQSGHVRGKLILQIAA